MVFSDTEPQANLEEGKMSLQLRLVPNDLFAELGISIAAKA
jgi:hypothetical protein